LSSVGTVGHCEDCELAKQGTVRLLRCARNDDTLSCCSNDDTFSCCDNHNNKIKDIIDTAKSQGDSIGGVVSFVINNCPVGLGEPVYEKLEARLAYAMLSIPASKGFEIGEGFAAATMLGSQHNDQFTESNSPNKVLNTNNAGGTLGGITNGMPVTGRVAFKPTSSIKKTQSTVSIDGKAAEFKLPEGSRHDPCVAIRAVPVVSAMCSLVIADFILMNRISKI